MNLRHKKPAIIGVAAWFAVIPVFICWVSILSAYENKGVHADYSRNETLTFIAVFTCLILQYIAFFWGAGHLAKAKGYSSGIIAYGILWPLQFILLAVLIFGLPDKLSTRPMTDRQRKSDRHESLIARVIRYRRNALIFNMVGLLGIALALATLFYMPVFARRDDNEVAVIFIFLPSYAAIIYGCWWWLKAKHWPDAVVLIGLSPLVILCIRYLRWIFRLVPLLLPAMMIMMPILMIGVIASLPDKSGLPKRKRWHDLG